MFPFLMLMRAACIHLQVSGHLLELTWGYMLGEPASTTCTAVQPPNAALATIAITSVAAAAPSSKSSGTSADAPVTSRASAASARRDHPDRWL